MCGGVDIITVVRDSHRTRLVLLLALDVCLLWSGFSFDDCTWMLRGLVVLIGHGHGVTEYP